MSRRSYPQYKPSGVEWLGEIPEHWGVLECKFGYSIQLGKMLQNEPQTSKDEQVPYLKAFYVNWEKVKASDLPGMWASPGDIRKYSVIDGDLLVCEGGEGGRAGILQNAPAKCIIQNALHRVRPRKNNSNQFLMYLLEIVSHRGWFDILCNKATIAHFTAEKFGWLSIALPLSYEQQAIAAFLDRETVRIDALMEKKQRQIELLQEKRAALISHVVTKGLDPNAPMKDSCVEWLGHIPAHWELKRLKFAAKIQTGLTLGKDYKNVPTISRPYLRVANVQDGYLDLNEITEIFIPEGDTKRHELQHGDVLMTEGGDFDKLGRGYVWEGQIEGCLHQNHIFAVRPNPKYLASLYLATLMTSSYGKAYFTSTSQQTTNLATTNITKLKNFLLPLPNTEEQCLILDWLGGNISKIDGLIAKIQDSLDKLKEYRTALISAAVTGKIDMREAGA